MDYESDWKGARMSTVIDRLHSLGIALPWDARGEVRTPCPQCSPSRRKHRDPCLAVNVDTGQFHCWHCG
jgi:hypothetical protein